MAKTYNIRQTYNGFHSEREETANTLQPKYSKANNQLNQQSEVILQFHINHTVRDLLMEFKKILKRHSGYKCMDMYEKQMLVVRLHFCDRLQKVLMCREPPKFIINVTTHEFKSVRSVSIKPLKCNNSFSYRERKSQDMAKDVSSIASKISESKILNNLSCKSGQPSNDMPELDSQDKKDFYSLDAISYYMMSKMLIGNNYTLGKKMQRLIQSFNYEGQPIHEMKRQQILFLNLALNQISSQMLQGFNCSRKELLQILCYCRKSVEEFYYQSYEQEQANINYKLRSQQPQQNLQARSQREQLKKWLPSTSKQLLTLQASSASMVIYRQLFMISYIFQWQCWHLQINQDLKKRCLQLINAGFAGLLNAKARVLRYGGYREEEYESFISHFVMVRENSKNVTK